MLNYSPKLQDRKIVAISHSTNNDDGMAITNDLDKLIGKIRTDLKPFHIEFDFIEINNVAELDEKLKKYNRDDIIVANWYKKLKENQDTAYLITDYLLREGYIFSGADSDSIKTSTNRAKMYITMKVAEVMVPDQFSFNTPDNLVNFPVIVRTIDKHTPKQLKGNTILQNAGELQKFKTDNVIDGLYMEKYINGREFSIVVFGNERPEMLPMTETTFNAMGKNVSAIEPENLDAHLVVKINNEAYNGFKALNGCGISRMKIRTENDVAYIIDANPNPSFTATTGLLVAARQRGYSEGLFIAKLCEYAIYRWS